MPLDAHRRRRHPHRVASGSRVARRRRSGRTSLVATVVAGAALLAACTSDDASLPATTTSTTTTTTVPDPQGDGRLVLGVLLPTSGSGAQLGSSLLSGVELAVERINEAGGVLGEPVTLVEVDEGSSASSAALGIETLVADGVDAIIGPASSLVALGSLNTAVSSGVVTCSPTATAIALDDFPDDGLFFRTAPSDTLQAMAIAQLAEQTGVPRVSILHLDDAYGRGLADAVDTALVSRNVEVGQRIGYSPGDGELAPLTVSLLSDEPGVVVVLADATSGAEMLASLAEAAPLWLPTLVIVNDSLRNARSSSAIADLPSALRERIEGVAPLASPPGDGDFSEPFSAHAYDCVNLVALAATQAGSDVPSRIATQMSAVSVGGSVCRSFASCADRIADDLQIDYHGPSGEIQLSSRGDPRHARFEVFEFDEDARDVSTERIIVVPG